MFAASVSRQALAVFMFAAILVPLQGCVATRAWVTEQLSPVSDRMAKLEGQMGQMAKLESQIGQVESRLPLVEDRLTSAESRITRAASKADDAEIKAEKALSSVSNLRIERRLELRLSDGVLYGFDSAMLTDEGKKRIDVFLSDIGRDVDGHRVFVVGGHTDSVGTDHYNYLLGRRRAESVAEYLILQKKLDPTRVMTVSLGESSPSTDNGSRDGREKNRRVEIRVYSDAIVTSSATPLARR